MYTVKIQKLKELVNLITLICPSLSSLQPITKELTAVNFLRHIGLEISDITEIVLFFQYSDIFFK